MQQRDAPTATWATRTSSWGSLKWQQNITSQFLPVQSPSERPLRLLLEVQRVSCPCRRTLQLARQLKDRAVEAQACYSLGNTYTLLQDYERAIDYHLKHLIIAQDLNDRWVLRLILVDVDRRRRRELTKVLVALQDRGRPSVLESGECTHCTGEPRPSHALR